MKIIVVDNKRDNLEDAKKQLEEYQTEHEVILANNFDEGLRVLNSIVLEGRQFILLTDLYMTTEDSDIKNIIRRAFPQESRLEGCLGESYELPNEEVLREDPLGVILFLKALWHGGFASIVTTGGHHGKGLQCVLSFFRKHGSIHELCDSYSASSKQWSLPVRLVLKEGRIRGQVTKMDEKNRENVRAALVEVELDTFDAART